MSFYRSLLLCLFVGASLTILLPQPASSQSGNAFSIGNQLLRDGEFEEAYEIFRELMTENPRSFAVYDRAVTALVNLKRYDDAITITKERLGYAGSDVNTMVKLGEIYHISGDEEEAFRAWEQIIERHAGNPHSYRRVAETMNQRRLYREAIVIYEMAQEQLRDSGIFAFEIANNYLAINDFESALNVYLDILGNDEQRISQIQRQLLNYDEFQLYDLAIILTQERVEQLPPGSSRDLTYRDFLVWLNMERGLYRRALAAARTLEQNSGNERHIMFRIGRQLRGQQEFELAEEAFAYYIDMEDHPLQPRSYEELSRSYKDWAAFLVDKNLDFDGAADSLYHKAFDTVERLTNRYPRYDRIIQTLSIQAELALDHLKRPEAAAEYHKKMQDAAQSDSDKAIAYYIEGRLLLFNGEFSMARVSFTRSNRLAGSGEIAERSRFYLGLGDFYNEEFAFSRLQLRTLERQNTSFFANNALQLRYMIQDAFEEDGENNALKRYARARYLYDTGKYSEAADLLVPVLDESVQHPLQGESMLLFTRILRKVHPEIAFHVIDRYTNRPSVRQNAGERMLWERARLAELVRGMHGQSENRETELQVIIPPKLSAHAILSGFDRFSDDAGHTVPGGEKVVEYYEELLMNYPDGYYADLARVRIRDLERENREL